MLNANGRHEPLPYGQIRAVLASLAAAAWVAYLGLYIARVAGAHIAEETWLAALVAAMLTMSALAVWIVAHIEHLSDVMTADQERRRAAATKLVAPKQHAKGAQDVYWAAFADISEDLLTPRPDDRNAN